MDESLPILVSNSFEDEVVVLSTRTMLKLFQLGADAYTLYSFYCITAKRQSIALRKRITTIKANQAYTLKGLSWGETRFRSAKKVLVDNGLVKNVIKKDDQNKIIGYYIQVNYIPMESSSIENQRVGESSSWASPVLAQPSPNTGNNITSNNITNNINTVKDNTNTDIGGLSKNFEPVQAEDLTKEILIHFNTVYNTKYKSPTSILKLAEHWLESYTIDEIKQAITNSYQDQWWRDKLTPTILLRKMNPNREPVDYIGKFLNMSVGQFDSTPLTPLKLWEIAKEYDINLEDVNRKYKDVITESERGNFPSKYKYDSIEQALRSWLEIEIRKGTIKHCNDVEKMQLENDHPERVAERNYYFGKLREKGELD